jgi:uncharacterized protein YbjQ (UPF0145 family)
MYLLCVYAHFVLVVTTNDLPGFDVLEVLGEVFGTTARSQNSFIEGVKSLRGGANPRGPAHLANWRADAVDSMVEAARRRGANAVIGMRFDHRVVSDYWTEICAYGTAVVVARRAGPADDGEHQRQSMEAGT